MWTEFQGAVEAREPEFHQLQLHAGAAAVRRRAGSPSTTSRGCRTRCASKPDDFVAFPAPAGPKGRGFMPVLVGLAVPKDAPDAAGAKQLIDYLLQAGDADRRRCASAGFFPVVKVALPADLDPGLKLEAQAVAAAAEPRRTRCRHCCRSASARRAASSTRSSSTRSSASCCAARPAQDVLAREAEDMQRVLMRRQAPCWSPDPPSQGACQVK